MIVMMGVPLDKPLPNLTEKGKGIFEALKNSKTPHFYRSYNELIFELLFREKIIDAAIALSKSEAEFNVYSQSRFNPLYWTKTSRGYVLKRNAAPNMAISDIYINGQEYAFECSTAMVIVYYYAVLNVIGPRYFNQLFRNLIVWNWSYDEDLRIITKSGKDFIPGDVLYFHNPDFKHPVWIGENAVYLGNNMYYGHDIGVVTKEKMIETLNSLRKPNATRSAYLLPQYSRLDFNYYRKFT